MFWLKWLKLIHVGSKIHSTHFAQTMISVRVLKSTSKFTRISVGVVLVSDPASAQKDNWFFMIGFISLTM
jgi:hypothetical protein